MLGEGGVLVQVFDHFTKNWSSTSTKEAYNQERRGCNLLIEYVNPNNMVVKSTQPCAILDHGYDFTIVQRGV